MIKSVSTYVNGRFLELKLPDKKSIILKGTLSDNMLYLIECLLSQDMSGYYLKADNADYVDMNCQSVLAFGGGHLYGMDGKFSMSGVVPKVHVIRVVGQSFRSFYTQSEQSEDVPIYSDMTEYNDALDRAQWLRLVGMVNDFVGFEMVRLDGSKLEFTFDRNGVVQEEDQKFIYLLFAECFLTPEGYQRIMLIPDIETMSSSIKVKLIETVDNIKGHLQTLSTANIDMMDVSEKSCISFASV